jgi:uncharacterized protein (DUF362 family)
MTKVSIVRTEQTPNLQSIREHLQRSIELIGGLDSFVTKKSKVLLKPNAGAVVESGEPRNTDPRIIEAMIMLLQELGVNDILVGESSIVGIDTMTAFRSMGIDAIAERSKVQLIDLKKLPFKEKIVPDPFILSSIKISSLVDEVDAIINLPKLKTGLAVPVSLGLKNLKGFLPDAEKKRFHHTHLSKAIADLAQIVKPHLTIIDGITASELYEPKETNILFAGSDVLAVDAVAARAVDLNPAEIEYMALAEEAGVGTIDLEHVQVVGRSLYETHVDLKKGPNQSKAYIDLFPEVKIIDGEACSGCVGVVYMGLKFAKERGTLEGTPGLTLAMGPRVKEVPAGDRVLCLGN